jgi:hypothetical protein
MKLTRRQLAVLISSTAALSETQAKPQTQPPVVPVDEIEAARARLKANGAQLAQYELPMATEPAFQFKV